MLQSELHSSSILEAKLSPSNQPLFIVVHEENGLAQLQIRITDGTQHWPGHIVADDIQASNDEMRTQKFTLTRSALKPPTNEIGSALRLATFFQLTQNPREAACPKFKRSETNFVSAHPTNERRNLPFSDPVGLQRAAEQECCSAAGPQFEARIFFEGKLGSPPRKLFKINCRLVRMNFTIISSMFSRPRRRKLES